MVGMASGAIACLLYGLATHGWALQGSISKQGAAALGKTERHSFLAAIMPDLYCSRFAPCPIA
jgi:hypothetical protein